MALKGRKMAIMLTAAFLAMMVAAWFDGGEEPIRPIEQRVDLPENTR